MSKELESAYQNRDRERAKEIITAVKDPNKLYASGQTPLIMATWYGDKESVEWLLSHGAKVDLADKFKCTALHRAAERKEAEIVNLLLEKKANVNKEDDDKKTPLETAIFEQAPDAMISALIAHGSKIDHRNSWKMTPLMVACQQGHVFAAQQLMEKGADVNAGDVDGATPLYWALENYGSYASTDKYDAIIHLLLKNKARLDIKHSEGKTILMQAAFAGHLPVVELCLKNKIGVNDQDNQGKTALVYAESMTRKDTPAVIQHLMEAGAQAAPKKSKKKPR